MSESGRPRAHRTLRSWTALILMLVSTLLVGCVGTQVAPAATAPGASPSAPLIASWRYLPTNPSPTPATRTSPPAAGSTLPPSTAKPAPKPPASTPAPQAPRGQTRIAIKSQGFSVALVTGWVAISIEGKPNDAGITALLRAAGSSASSSASASAVLEGMKAMLPGGVRLIACRPAGLNLTAKFVPVFVMYRGPAESITLDALESLSVQQMAMTSYIIGAVKHRQISMKPGRVIWWSYHQRIAGADGAMHDSYINQYALLRDGNEYVAVFATLKAATGTEQRQFEAIVDSLAFFPASTATS